MTTVYRHDGEISAMDWFCGAGGSSQGMDAVPGVRVTRAANHWDEAIATHSMNFPATDHWQGDIRTAPVEKWPVTQLFWASPECPKWTVARGKRRDFHNTNQAELPGLERPRNPEDERSRALMEEVPMYLRGVQERGGLVLAGVVENVIDCRAWDQWDRWLGELHKLGYATRTIAFNSMHARSRTLGQPPQSRDRLYVAYWHHSLGRTPDWDKWLRPHAYCSGCDAVVAALQVFKRVGADMGRYGRTGQYVYRCPNTRCRNQVVEPAVRPALTVIDWSLPGVRIGDRKRTAAAPEGLKPKTMARIRAGLAKYAQPVLVPSGGTWRTAATSVTAVMPTRTTRENDALAIPPLLIPAEGRDGKEASTAHTPLRTQTARNETGLAWLPPSDGLPFEPFITPVRGGGDAEKARALTVPLHAVTAGGNHHGLVTPPAMSGEALQTLLVPYYGNGNALRADQPIGAITTKDRWALVQSLADIDINDVLYRMLEPHEIGRGMAFADGYRLSPRSKRHRVRLYGNAVTPPVAELLISALVEAITGETLEVAA
ncbi:DNA cytosine methyltransferase [Streptomyces sp. NPDC001262]|uniref:DNA cytosine methyltransferase n=1 Tax=Streptomyces sp. NPDC001262 TaxID=3364552 RepID=UPI0036A0D065